MEYAGWKGCCEEIVCTVLGGTVLSLRLMTSEQTAEPDGKAGQSPFHA